MQPVVKLAKAAGRAAVFLTLVDASGCVLACQGQVRAGTLQ